MITLLPIHQKREPHPRRESERDYLVRVAREQQREQRRAMRRSMLRRLTAPVRRGS